MTYSSFHLWHRNPNAPTLVESSNARKLSKHSIEALTSPSNESENGSDGGPSSPKKECLHHHNNNNNSPTKERKPEKVVSYTEMIAKAIFSTTNSMSTLADIYSYLIIKYPFLQSRGKSWKNSVRHTLSLNEWFIKIPKLDNAKCCYWSVHPIYIQRFRRGDFQKQRKASIPKFRSHHNHHHHHPSRYYDMCYDINSPTLDYHFFPPPPPSQHFQQQQLGPDSTTISPSSHFLPPQQQQHWPPITSRPQFEEFQTFFPPQHQQQYNHHGYPPSPHPYHYHSPVYNNQGGLTSPHPSPPQNVYQPSYCSTYYNNTNSEHDANYMIYSSRHQGQQRSQDQHHYDVRPSCNRNTIVESSSFRSPIDDDESVKNTMIQQEMSPVSSSGPNEPITPPSSYVKVKIEESTGDCQKWTFSILHIW